MKAKNAFITAIALALAFVVGLFIGKGRASPQTETSETKETIVDTIPYYAPKAQSELGIGTQLYTLPVYRFHGSGAGGEPRQCGTDDKETIEPDTIANLQYGLSAGGEPRCWADSATVELPIIQRHYADSTYEAWVSGPVDPRLDSVRVFAQTTIITKREWKPPKRWHIGVTAGYGYTLGKNRFDPYIGVGVTYSIISF